jgi:pheromone shutdown-related protein TraB
MTDDSASSNSLPPTVTSLEVDGRSIHLVGTAHVSKTSVADVRSTLALVEPETVCVELCEPRYRNLTNPDSWRKVNILQILRSGKAMLLLSSLIMSSFQRRIADQLGVQPGAEMLAAIEAAESSGAELVLADREIEITLKRTGAKLSFWMRMKILSQLLAGLVVGEEISEDEIEKLKEQAHLADALQLLAKEFPQAKETLIDERDTFLAQKIREAPGKTIVAVVGAGHVEGIKREILEDHDLEPLVVVPPPSAWTKVFKWGIPALIIGIFVYGFFFGDPGESRDSLLLWILINGGLSAAGAALALGHPLTVASAFVAAPLTSLNPLIAAGWIAGLVQAWIKNPTVQDLEDLPKAISTLRGFRSNAVTRVLLVVVLSNLGSMFGTFIGGGWIAARVFGSG